MGMAAIFVMWPEPLEQFSFPHPKESPYAIRDQIWNMWSFGMVVSEEELF